MDIVGAKCPYCDAGEEYLLFHTRVYLSFGVTTDNDGKLMIDANSINDISSQDIAENIDDDNQLQELYCTRCGSNVKSHIEYKGSKMYIKCDK